MNFTPSTWGESLFNAANKWAADNNIQPVIIEGELHPSLARFESQLSSAPIFTQAAPATGLRGVQPILSMSEQIKQLFRYLLGREVDQAGLDYFLGLNKPIEQIKVIIMNSMEYRAHDPHPDFNAPIGPMLAGLDIQAPLNVPDMFNQNMGPMPASSAINMPSPIRPLILEAPAPVYSRDEPPVLQISNADTPLIAIPNVLPPIEIVRTDLPAVAGISNQGPSAKAINNFINSNTGLVLELQHGYSQAQIGQMYVLAVGNGMSEFLDSPQAMIELYGSTVRPSAIAAGSSLSSLASELQISDQDRAGLVHDSIYRGTQAPSVGNQISGASAQVVNQILETAPKSGGAPDLFNIANPSTLLANPFSQLSLAVNTANAAQNAANGIAFEPDNSTPLMLGAALAAAYFLLRK